MLEIVIPIPSHLRSILHAVVDSCHASSTTTCILQSEESLSSITSPDSPRLRNTRVQPRSNFPPDRRVASAHHRPDGPFQFKGRDGMPPTVFSYPHPLSPEKKMQEKAHIEKNKDGDHGCFEESRENGLNYRSGRDSFFRQDESGSEH